jgi:hypothetical protein
MLKQDLLSRIIHGSFSPFKATLTSIALNWSGNASKHLFISFYR